MGRGYTIQPSFSLLEGDPNEVTVLAWLSVHLEPAEWAKVCATVGERRLLKMPLTVLGLAPRARAHFEIAGVRTVQELTAQSAAQLRLELHGVAYDGLIRRVKLFGLQLAP